MGTREAGSSSRAADEVPAQDRNGLTDLLQMPYCNSRIYGINLDRDAVLKTKAYRTKIQYHHLCQSRLMALGLYQVSRLPQMPIDPKLITALTERWRPEAHTFHFRFGELTVTLQDVSCLWGLPISGRPVTGHSDVGAEQWVSDFLDDVPSEAWKKKKRNRTDGDGEVSTTTGELKYAITLCWLRNKYGKMPENPSKEQIDVYTRAFLLDLFGSVLFPDSSGDCVPVMWLQFMDFKNPLRYNWGAAVLATLYRNLTVASRAGSRQIAGSLLLLQQWSWTYFMVGRPRERAPFPLDALVGDDVDDAERKPCHA